ncbi:MAG: TatD family hydrolase [Patescibacteria group bacterium]
MLYDTHSHLNFKAFADDCQTVIKNSLKQGMFLNIVGSQFLTSKRAVEIANEFRNDPVYATVGLHPSHVGNSKFKIQNSKLQFKIQNCKDEGQEVHRWDYEKYKKLAVDQKVVAIGETGLDYYRTTDNHAVQKQIFLEHIKLAAELKKPLIIHCRPSKNTFSAKGRPASGWDAYFDLIDILNQKLRVTSYKLQGVVHCFLANWPIAKQLLDLNLYISFTGIITYKNIDDYLIDAIKKIPLERIMIETDSPYLTPEPHRGKKRNEPLYVEYVARKIAEIKGIDGKIVIDATTKNGKNLFDIKK